MQLDTSRPFTRRQGHAVGLTDKVLRGPRFQRLLDGVYLAGDIVVRPEHRAQAAALVGPADACLSHASVARLLGAPIPHDPDEHLTVSSKTDRLRRAGVRCHVAALGRREQGLWRGLRVTSAARMFSDLAATLPLVDLVVLGDWLVRKGHVTLSGLRGHCAERQGPGSSRAREAATYVRENVDSPMETRLRMLLVLAGIPEPEINVEIRAENGDVVFRLDLCYRRIKVVIEYDGRHHVDVRSQWEKDLRRRELLESAGWRVIVVTSQDVYAEPGGTVRRIHETLGARGLRLPALRGDWRRHFPGRAA